ncbi:MAG: hypothetical protein ACPLW8_06160 [Candidatus Bathyarchaeales archaeon]
MVKKKKRVEEKKLAFSQKQLIAASIVLSLIIATALIIFASRLTDVPFSLNAAIIDQLGESDPLMANYTFVENIENLLKSRGFDVTYYNESLDVNFFKGLTKLNSGIIILRVHSALRNDNSTVDLFTSEEYSGGKYKQEKQQDLVVIGQYLYTNETKSYYAITHKFIENLEGSFPKSIVIAMGCWSLKPECRQLAEAFIKKHAKAYIGWTSAVLSKDTDQDTITFLERLLIQNKTLKDAIADLKHTYYDPKLNQTIVTRMNFYPPSESDLRISTLLAEVKSYESLAALSLDGLIIFMAKVEFKNCLLVADNASRWYCKVGGGDYHRLSSFFAI